MRCLIFIFCLACTSPTPSPKDSNDNVQVEMPMALIQSSLGDAPVLEPGRLRVRRGQRVELRLKHAGATMHHHLHVLPPVDVKSRDPLQVLGALKPGESKTTMFQAPSQPGRYPIRCTSKDYTPGPCGVLWVE
ncbi:MAG TPA: hypothetical protein DEB46_10350 [Myxococcales bacterium]|nr:hypothetical protein [Myxococcales bacterium]